MWLLSMMLLSGLTLATNACSPNDEPINTETPTQKPDDPNPETPDPDAPNTQPDGDSSALVVYFSCTNTTKGIADRIVEATDAVTWRIEPEVATGLSAWPAVRPLFSALRSAVKTFSDG